MPPNDRTLGERAFETIVKGYRDIRGAENLPADQRVYMESVIDRRRDPLTEKSFKPEELEAIRNVITRRYDALKPKFQQDIADMRQNAASDLQEAYRAKDPETRQSWLRIYRKSADNIKDLQAYVDTGKLTPKVLEYAQFYGVNPNIQYDDYKDSYEIAADGLASSSGEGAIGQTLGRFVYDVDQQGNLNIKDAYDFGPGFSPFTKQPVFNERIGLGSLFTPKGAAVRYGRTYLPTGQGRPVNIRVNSLAPPKAKAKEPENWFSRTATALGF
jgi:hypothetical protein